MSLPTAVRRLLVAVVVVLALSAGPLAARGPGAEPAFAATPRTSLTDIEDEVMCPVCGTLLELAQSPQSQRERAFIARLISRGKTKAEIEDALVAQYGSEVLALPKSSGFDLSAYLIPAIAFAIAAVGLGIGVARWRKAARRSAPEPPSPPALQGEDADRLDADLARYDL